MMFANGVAGGTPTELEFTNNFFGSKSAVRFDRKDVATVEKKRWKMNHQYEVAVAQGLDMSLLTGLVIAFDDKVKTQQRIAAVATHGSSGEMQCHSALEFCSSQN